jgi:hypothetical protein
VQLGVELKGGGYPRVCFVYRLVRIGIAGILLPVRCNIWAPCDWVGSSGLCRPYFRLAIGSALSAFVVPIFALRLGRL